MASSAICRTAQAARDWQPRSVIICQSLVAEIIVMRSSILVGIALTALKIGIVSLALTSASALLETDNCLFKYSGLAISTVSAQENGTEPPAEEPEEQPAEDETATDEEPVSEEPVAEAEPEEEPPPPPPTPMLYSHPVRQNIPEAFILPEGWLSIAYLNRSFDEDSLASQGNIDSNGYRFDYGLSDRVQLGLRLWQNDTNNGRAIIVPFWDNTITADMWETDIKLFLSGTPRPEPGTIPDDKLPSAFSIGISHQDSSLSREQADDDLRILTGYVCYSAYLNPKLATHTYFSTGRFTGDLMSGTMNTLAAGLDYDLLDERDKLRLSLDGALDIYNFRQTSFSATRVSHVNVGLKYMVSRNIELSAGYGIHTDSDSDLSSTEFQFGLAFYTDILDMFGRSGSDDEETPAE